MDADQFRLRNDDNRSDRRSRRVRNVLVIDAARTDDALRLIDGEPDARYTVIQREGEPEHFAPKPKPAKTAKPSGSEAEPQRADPSLTARYRGVEGERRAAAVRAALDGALDDWWRDGALLDPPLLRDALLVLEAGHALNESSRSLLLRAALHHGRGMLTALRHQTDPERTAFLLHEAVVGQNGQPGEDIEPLPPEALRDLQRADQPRAAAWSPPLLGLLHEDAAAAGTRRAARAHAALDALTGGDEPGRTVPVAVVTASWPLARPAHRPAPLAVPLHRRHSWFQLGILLTLLLLIGVIGLWRWLLWEPPAVVDVPGGSYSVARVDDNVGVGNVQISLAEADGLRTVDLAPFVIDRFEVTNCEYARCLERGACPAPVNGEALSNPALVDHPVANVTWDGAAAYCAFANQRLPTAAEWEVAASYSTATNRYFRYPWGDRFEPRLTNSARSGVVGTQAVGSYAPTGDSPLGLSDAAGNVAEWTVTANEATDAGTRAFIVKGGGFHDGDEALLLRSQRVLPASVAEPWLGFRCAADTS